MTTKLWAAAVGLAAFGLATSPAALGLRRMWLAPSALSVASQVELTLSNASQQVAFGVPVLYLDSQSGMLSLTDVAGGPTKTTIIGLTESEVGVALYKKHEWKLVLH